MKQILILFFTTLSLCSFSQEVDIEKETSETLNWINSKITEYQYEDTDMKQICYFTGITERVGQEYLVGIREQRTSKPWRYKYKFMIPLSMINNISFEEKTANFWLNIRMKNNLKVIVLEKENGESVDPVGNMEIMLNKNVTEEDIDKRLLKAFNYLLEIRGYKKVEKF